VKNIVSRDRSDSLERREQNGPRLFEGVVILFVIVMSGCDNLFM